MNTDIVILIVVTLFLLGVVLASDNPPEGRGG